MSSVKVFYLLFITALTIAGGRLHAQALVGELKSCAFTPPAPLPPTMVRPSTKNNLRHPLAWFSEGKKAKAAERQGGRASRKAVARRHGRLTYPILNPLKHQLPDINITEPEVPFPNPGVMVSAILTDETA